MNLVRSLAPRGLFFFSLFCVAFVVYLPAVQNDFVWDDDSYITHDKNNRSWVDLRDIWVDPWSTPQYYPLVHTAFWIEYQLWGKDPVGYHLANIVLHGLNSGLIWVMLRRLGFGSTGAWIVAALFAVHPIHVESVAWATERKNVLSATLALISLLACLRFYRINKKFRYQASGDSVHVFRWRWYSISLLFYLAALLSKTVVSTLPVVLLVILWWKRGRLDWRSVVPLSPFFVFGAILGSCTAYLEVYHVGAIGQDWDFSMIERLLIAGRAMWFYVAKLIWPYPLIFNYPRWTIESSSLLPYIAPLGVLAVVLGLLIRVRSIGRGPVAAVLIFVVVMFPALGFFDVYPMRFSFVADHFVYTASIALIGFIVASTTNLLRRVGPVIHWIGMAAVFPLIMVLGVLTWERCLDFADAETLWLDTIEKNPKSMIAYSALGGLRLEQNQLDQAEFYLSKAVESRPDHPQTHEHMALLFLRLGKTNEAILEYKRALLLYHQFVPERGVVHTRLAGLYADRGDLAGAQEHYRLALTCRPRRPDEQLRIEWLIRSYRELGLLMLENQELDEALALWGQLVRIDPKNISALYHLGLTCQRLGQLHAAMECYLEVIDLDPHHALSHNNMGVLLAGHGRPTEALRHFKTALVIRPDDLEMHGNLFRGYVQAGQLDQAIQAATQAAEMAKAQGNTELAEELRQTCDLLEGERSKSRDP